MNAALNLGRRGQGRVWPNPAVGCVIVKDGIVVGRGRTADGGRPHAETEAIAQAGSAAKGATAFVTLEPCAHHGKTPPCAEAIVKAGISRVVIATTDPDPRVAGRGIAQLKAAGIAVETGLSASLADFDHAGFFKRIQENRPYVTLKLATTLDGRIATKTGDSQWITGPQARRAVHAMRARYDAVMVGAGTARADDPQLNVRGMGDVRQPVRVVVSKSLELPTDSKLMATSETQPVWLVHGPDANGAGLGQTGVQLVAGKLDNGEVDLADAMTQLAEKGLTRIFCEGGGRLASSLLRNDLVDELIMFTAGVAIGADGLPSLGEMGLEKLSDAPRFSLLSSQRVGSDIMHRWSVVP